LQGDPNIEVDSAFYLTNEKVFSVTEQTSKESLQKESTSRTTFRFPNKREDLNKYDCVILGRGLDDVLTPADEALLREFVSDRGGSIVMLRGRAGETLAALNDIAPVQWDDELLRDVKLELTGDGRVNPIFSFHQPQPSDVIVRSLPQLISVTRVRAEKSLAVVLAAAGAGTSTNRVAAIAYQRVGRGKVMSIGAVGLWHWAFMPDSQNENQDVYQQLWAQIVRWMVSDSDFLPGQDISFRTDRYVYQPGERVRFIVRSKTGSADFHPFIEVHPPAAPPVALKAARAPDSDDHIAWLNGDAEGEYRAVLRDSSGKAAAEDVRFTVYADFDEARLVAADPDLLANIARTTGGQMIKLDEMSRLPGLLKSAALAARQQEKPKDAWDNGNVFFCLISLFSIEWYFRRKWGLV
jgi:uncharacterized membrane protein